MTEKRNFITTEDWTKDGLNELLDLAVRLKKEPYNEDLKNRSLFMVFFNPSLRTRSSFEMAMLQCGGSAVNLSVGQDTWKLEHKLGTVMDGAASEHIKDASKVLSRYGDAIGVRCFPEMNNWEEDAKDSVINGFADNSAVPVVNMESSMYHPCQGLADMMTVRENVGVPHGKKIAIVWCYHPKPLPMSVSNSAALISSKFGMDVSIVCPERYELSDRVVDTVKTNCAGEGSKFRIVHDITHGVEDADIVYAKSWGSLKYYGDWAHEKQVRDDLKSWKITQDIMEVTNDAKFMHCLPVRRNVVVDDNVIDGENSVVYDQAENRLHSQKALLTKLLGDA